VDVDSTNRSIRRSMTMIKQAMLTAECWMIQMFGPDQCKACECRAKPNQCGGLKIRETGKNEKGHDVPVGSAA
jgi:hypothetical protein